MAEDAMLGEQLLAKGWRQGRLLPATPAMIHYKYTPGSPAAWTETRRDFTGGLVLATQTCDMKRLVTEEPTVEFVRAFWTKKDRIITAAKRNSVRQFLLRTRASGTETEGLVAEATTRVFVDKKSLLQFTPEQGCSDANNERQFQRWLARRYDRPALPDALVAAVQKPIVDALRAEPETSRIWTLLRGVSEVRYDANDDGPPYSVSLILIREEEDGPGEEPISEPDAEDVAAWFTARIAAAGEAKVTRWDVADLESISVAEYAATVPLPLDEYSL
jgi:hypothetical protein